MKTEVFVLLVTLVFTDGLDNATFIRDKRGLSPNRAYPCQRSQNNNAYNIFQHRHIFPDTFDRTSTRAWAGYLNRARLCGRKRFQSFIPQSYTNSITEICNGRGTRGTGNLCISTEMFTVYIIESYLTNERCEVKKPNYSNYYVTVACAVIDNQCVPVHYDKQTSTRPSQRGQTCEP